jgi:hypothetical protein
MVVVDGRLAGLHTRVPSDHQAELKTQALAPECVSCHCSVAAVDDSIYMLPDLELPPVLHGLLSDSSVLEQELKELIEGVVFEAGGFGS